MGLYLWNVWSPLTCLNLTSNMNGKKFLDRVIHVSAVVSVSPQKQDIQLESCNENKDSIASAQIKMPSRSLIVSSVCQAQSTSKSVVDSPSQKSVEDKISHLESQTSGFVFETPFKDTGKRKSADSPENKNLSKKEKKLLKSEERRAEKLQKKLNSQVQVQLTHSD